MLADFIPGRQGEVVPGLRRLNWVWYVHVDPADQPDVLTDSSGSRHHASLPRGATPEKTISELKARAARELHSKMSELVAETHDPFLQTIVDVTVPRTLFGRFC